MVDTTFVVLDSIAIFLVVVPMPWHLSAWNTATCYMMIWTVLACIIYLVNSIVWYQNLSNPAPIYCDIATKILMGTSVAIPLSSLCINRRLYNIAKMQSAIINRNQRRRDMIIDTLVAVLCPLIFMAVHYTQQGHRYDIVENFGCWPTIYLTAPAYVLVVCPPIVVCSISLVYCTLTIRAFLKRRHDFATVLQISSKGLNSRRYFRLMALASAEIVIGLPTSLYFLITNLKESGVQPWISWSDTHWNFSNVIYWPAYDFKVRPALGVAFQFDRWSAPFIAFLFFVFFGLSDEAIANYRRAFFAIVKPLGIQPKSSSPKSASMSSSFNKASDGKAKNDGIVLPPPYYPQDVESYDHSLYFVPSSPISTSGGSLSDKIIETPAVINHRRFASWSPGLSQHFSLPHRDVPDSNRRASFALESHFHDASHYV